MSESSSARLRSSVSSPGMPKTYSTPSDSRQSTNRSAALGSSMSQLLPTTRVSSNVAPSIMKARLLICFALLALPASADAASRFTIRGAGFGHGVGMSQYGAYGFAEHGWTYDDILAHYYTDTKLDRLRQRPVRVLLQGSVSSASVSGATSAGGRRLSPSKTYYVRHGSGANTVDLLSASGRRLKRVSTMLTVSGKKLR